MHTDSARRLAVALAIQVCRYLTLAWPLVIIIDVLLRVYGLLLPGSVWGAQVAVTCVALADWIRRGLIAAQVAADADRDRILARVHDRIDDVRATSRIDLDKSVAWLLRRLDRGA